jgi:hypothetical protein
MRDESPHRQIFERRQRDGADHAARTHRRHDQDSQDALGHY